MECKEELLMRSLLKSLTSNFNEHMLQNIDIIDQFMNNAYLANI